MGGNGSSWRNTCAPRCDALPPLLDDDVRVQVRVAGPGVPVVEGRGDHPAGADLMTASVADARADDALLDELQRCRERGPVRVNDDDARRVIGQRPQHRHRLRGGERQVVADDGVQEEVCQRGYQPEGGRAGARSTTKADSAMPAATGLRMEPSAT